MADALRRLRALASVPPTRAEAADAPAWALDGSLEEAAATFSPPSRKAAAARRVACGAALEAVAVAAASELCATNRRDLDEASHAQRKKRLCQLYFDAFCAALWTSAHAEYLASLDAGVVEPAPPSVGTFPSAGSGFDLGDIFARRVAGRGGVAMPKTTETLAALLGRSTNPGTRGWDTVLRDALEHDGIRSVVVHSLAVSLTGMHPQLHPALRRPWPERMRVLRAAQHALADRGAVVESAAYVKESVRRSLASILSVSAAMHTALAAVGHPVRHLHQPPMQMPHLGMEGSMAAFADAGVRLATDPADIGVRDALDASFGARRVEQAALDAAGLGGVPVESSWLGVLAAPPARPVCASHPPSPLSGKGTADVHVRQPLVELAANVWSAAFRANFVAFWIFSQSHQARLARLDASQHAAIHGLNAATRLAATLDEPTALAAQRAALSNPSAGILTLAEAAAELGIDNVASSSPNGGARSADDGVRLLGEAGPVGAARLLAYARVAWVNEEVLIVELGARTRAMQSAALRRRLGAAPDTPLGELTMHAMSLCFCCECKRVANACATSASCQSFNELGVSSSQLGVGSPAGVVKLHCAKRSSAALRAAMAFQLDTKRVKVEFESIDRAAITRLSSARAATGADTGVAARVRRDAKNALEQRPRALACGAYPMVTIPILGRAIRVYKAWYALCSHCAAMVRVQTHLHRYGVEICCLRCDSKMILGAQGEAPAVASAQVAKVCRFCGQVDPERTGARWRDFKAPLDVAGPNAALPPPLRRVWFCPAHTRPWISTAIRTLETRAILAHIASNAKPIFGADGDARPVAQAAGTRKRKKAKALNEGT